MSYRHFYILHFVFYNLSRRMTGFYIFHRLIHMSETVSMADHKFSVI